MKADRYTKAVLTAIALLLGVIALRPLVNPEPAHAQSYSGDLYIEPGTYMMRSPDGMRQQLGKVVIDLHTGKVWGFPTGSNMPFPIQANGSTQLPVSTPFLLGRFDLDAMAK